MTSPPISPGLVKTWRLAAALLVAQALLSSVLLAALFRSLPPLQAEAIAVDAFTIAAALILAVGLTRHLTWAWVCTLLFAGYARHVYIGPPSFLRIISLALLLGVVICLLKVMRTIA